MAADIAQRSRTQYGVGDGVQQHVGVRMAQQAQMKWHGDTAYNQWAPGYQRVHVPAFTNPQVHEFAFFWVSDSSSASASAKSSG